MVRYLFILTGLCLLLLSPTGNGANVETAFHRHEIEMNASSALISFGDGFDFGTTAVYRFSPIRQMQLGSTFGFSVVDRNQTTRTGFLAMVGPSINLPFEERAENAFFLSGQAGIYWTTGGGSFEQFAFAFDFGKRFEIFPNVTYKPFFRVGRIEGAKVRFFVYLISASVVF